MNSLRNGEKKIDLMDLVCALCMMSSDSDFDAKC